MNTTNWAYTDTVKEHFMNPRNILKGSVEEFNPSGIGTVGSPACGDMMEVLIKVENDKITEFKWRTFGCASAIASTSALSELVTQNDGITLEDAYKITPEEIIRFLGGLPANKIHCSVLGDKALRSAINDFFEKSQRVNPYKEPDSPVVCHCNNVTEEDIKMEVLEGCNDFETLQHRTGISSGCGKCIDSAKQILASNILKYYSNKVYTGEDEQ